MTTSLRVWLEAEGRLLRLRLSRPKANLIDAAMIAALSRAQVIYIWTHDSIALGEDGPTHQPIEQLPALRAIPNLILLRPSDATETVEAWRVALAHATGPVGIVLTRQKVPVIDRMQYASAAGLAKGAYVLADAGGPEPSVILIATGSEVSTALEAHQRLTEEGIHSRVVSMPSWHEAAPAIAATSPAARRP